MKERLSKLLTVKSIVTIALTILFVIVALRGNIPQEVMTIFTTVIAFYFGTQSTKPE
jgi:galactitol-specific phosphotransferase system IIC component